MVPSYRWERGPHRSPVDWRPHIKGLVGDIQGTAGTPGKLPRSSRNGWNTVSRVVSRALVKTDLHSMVDF